MKRDSPLVSSGEHAWPTPAAGWRRALCRTYDATASWLVCRNARSAMAALDRAGRLAHAVRLHGPSVAEVSALYEWLPPRTRRQVAQRIAALRWKNRAAVALVDRDRTDRLAALVQWSADSPGTELFDGRGGRIVLACHVGAFHGIRAALASIKRAELVLRDMPMHDPASRAAALKRAVDHVRDGGIVVATIDGPGGSSTGEVTCLGRRIVFRRGPFVLARLTRAPLVPVVCAWTPRGQIDVRHGPAIEPPWEPGLVDTRLETAMAARIASWLDGYLRAEPQEIWLSTLRHFLAAPRADCSADSAAVDR